MPRLLHIDFGFSCRQIELSPGCLGERYARASCQAGELDPGQNRAGAFAGPGGAAHHAFVRLCRVGELRRLDDGFDTLRLGESQVLLVLYGGPGERAEDFHPVEDQCLGEDLDRFA
jgi:hypothetical protein